MAILKGRGRRCAGFTFAFLNNGLAGFGIRNQGANHFGFRRGIEGGEHYAKKKNQAGTLQNVILIDG